MNKYNSIYLSHVQYNKWYGPELATFEESCRTLMGTFNTILPEGSLKARVRCSVRDSNTSKEKVLGDTLGDETTGLVQLFRINCYKIVIRTYLSDSYVV